MCHEAVLMPSGGSTWLGAKCGRGPASRSPVSAFIRGAKGYADEICACASTISERKLEALRLEVECLSMLEDYVNCVSIESKSLDRGILKPIWPLICDLDPSSRQGLVTPGAFL